MHRTAFSLTLAVGANAHYPCNKLGSAILGSEEVRTSKHPVMKMSVVQHWGGQSCRGTPSTAPSSSPPGFCEKTVAPDYTAWFVPKSCLPCAQVETESLKEEVKYSHAINSSIKNIHTKGLSCCSIRWSYFWHLLDFTGFVMALFVQLLMQELGSSTGRRPHLPQPGCSCGKCRVSAAQNSPGSGNFCECGSGHLCPLT